MRLTRKTAPGEEPVALSALKLHARVDIADDDDLIASFGKAAREKVENDCGRALVTQTWTLYLDDFPDDDEEPILLPNVPLTSITTVKYYDSSNVQQTWSGTTGYEYEAASDVRPGRLRPRTGVSWPDVYDRLNAVAIEYVCGYGQATAVPDTLKLAIKLLVTTWYEHRELLMTGVPVTEIPAPIAYKYLIAPFVVARF